MAIVPCLNIVGLPFVGLGLLLGGIGIIVSKVGQKTGMGVPIAGTVVSAVGVVIAVGWLGAMALFVKDAETRLEKDRQEKLARMEREEQELSDAPAIAITAADLSAQYEADEDRADGRYKCTGIIKEVDADPDEPTIELKTIRDEDSINCHFTKRHHSKVRELKRGQQVTVRGKCKGSDVGDITLEPCVLK